MLYKFIRENQRTASWGRLREALDKVKILYKFIHENQKTANWEKLREALDEVKRSLDQKTLPLTIVYWRDNNLIGFYCCNDDEYPECILFADKDFIDSQLILELIYQHKELLNDAVLVCLLEKDAMNKWNPQDLINSINVFL